MEEREVYYYYCITGWNTNDASVSLKRRDTGSENGGRTQDHHSLGGGQARHAKAIKNNNMNGNEQFVS